MLDELIACVHYRILLCLDEGALCSTGTCCRSLCLGDGITTAFEALEMIVATGRDEVS